MPLNCQIVNKALLELLFEDFQVPSLFLSNTTEVGSLAAVNTGIILDIGETQATATAIYEGNVLATKQTSGICGRQITLHLRELLALPDDVDHETINTIKEKFCYIATPNFEAASQLCGEDPSLEKEVGIAHQNETITKCLKFERFTAPEVMLSPCLMGLDCLGVQHLIFDILLHCPPAARPGLISRIQLMGGSSSFEGLPERLKFELDWLDEALFEDAQIFKSEQDIEWLGSSILSSLSDFPSMLITRDQFHSKHID